MKIEGIHPFGKPNPYASSTVKGNGKAYPAAPKDQLEISAESLERLKEIPENIDPLRQKKIDALRKQVEEGTYSVPADQLADRILAWWRGR